LIVCGRKNQFEDRAVCLIARVVDKRTARNGAQPRPGKDAAGKPQTRSGSEPVGEFLQLVSSFNPSDPGPAGGEALARCVWRWAEPDGSFGISGVPNTKYRPDHEVSPWLTTGPYIAQGSNAGNNEELFSFRPGGVIVLMGDGSVRCLKDSVNLVTLRALVSLSGGEVISSDQY
jgi:hypothetical protein